MLLFKKKSYDTCSAHVFLLDAVQHWARCASLRRPGPSWVVSLRQFGAPRSVFQRENLHFMGSLNRKGGVSSWFSPKRSVIKPLPYNQYTNTSAGCVWCSAISIWAWGRNVVCVCFLLSFWISYRAESHGTDGTRDACWRTTGIK